MQHYRFHLNDYLSATVHLSERGDLCYRRLLDVYYRLEAPLPNTDRPKILAMIRMPDAGALLDDILNEFFVFEPDLIEGGAWVNPRAQDELNLYREWQDKSRKGAYASAEARRIKRGGSAGAGEGVAVLPTTTTTTTTSKETSTPLVPADAATPVVPYQEIVKAYHQKLPQLPKVKALTETRKKHIRARWHGELPDIETWEKYFSYVAQSPFLLGSSSDQRSWRADLEWLTKEANFVKVWEGKYHGK